MKGCSGAIRPGLRRVLAAIAATALAMTALAACGDSDKDSGGGGASSSGPVKVGLLASLTGPAAPQGEKVRQGAELAAATLSAEGKRKVELTIQDDQGDPQTGVAAFSQMVNAKGLKAIVGGGPSGVAMALKPIANRQKVVLLGSGVAAPAFPTANGFTFRTWIAADDLEGLTAKHLANDLKKRKLAILAENADTFKANGAVAKQVYEAAGGKVTGEEWVDGAQTDFLPQLTKLIATKPDVLMIEFTAPATIGNAVKQARQLGFKGPVQTSNNATNDAFLTAAKSAADGAFWTVPSVLDSATHKAFVTAYQAKYKSEPDTLAASAYDDVMLLGKAIEEVGNDGPAIKAWLAKQKDYDGASGPITFKPDGDLARKPVAVQTVKDGQITALDTGLS
jgi:branched-chain amino acid transport system substrate-binding protein